jgi:hypothetical protein
MQSHGAELMGEGRGMKLTALLAAAAVAASAGCAPKPAANATSANGTPTSSASAGAPAPADGNIIPVSTGGGGSSVFTDPDEDAFTISAPAGWAMKGGVVRRSSLSATPWITATSADGTEVITYGDPSVPTFIFPSAQHPQGTSDVAVGGPQTYEPYETGAQFAADYAQHVFASGCTELTQTGSQAESDLAQKAAADGAEMTAMVGNVQTPPPNFDGGSATFSCQVNGQAYVAGVIAVTAVSRFGPYGVWTVPTLISYRAPAADAQTIDAIARTMRNTYQRNQAWLQKMASVTHDTLAQMQAQGARDMAAQKAQEAADSRMLAASGAAESAALNSQHAAFMQQFNAEGAARNANFANQQAAKASGQQAEMRYIQNQTCIAWYDAAHTQCKATAQN